MNLTKSVYEGVPIIHINGRVDTIRATDFERQVLDIIDENTSRLIFDCSGLDYISSTGLRVFLVVLKKMISKGGWLRLSTLKPPIKEIFNISGFSSIFMIYPDIESATTNL